MTRHPLLVSSMFVLLLLLTNQAFATDLPRVLIMGEDADPKTVPRDTDVFRQVLQAVTHTLSEKGFGITDEQLLPQTSRTQGRIQRNDTALIQAAKQTDIDVLCIISVYPDVRSSSSDLKITARIEGRLLAVADGQSADQFQHRPTEAQPVPRPYNQQTLTQSMEKLSQVVGQAVGQMLASRLSDDRFQSAESRSKI